MFIKQIFTGKDNATFDIVRVGAGGGIICALVLAMYDVIKMGNHFDIQSFGIGFGAMLGAVGAALVLKKDTEPQP